MCRKSHDIEAYKCAPTCPTRESLCIFLPWSHVSSFVDSPIVLYILVDSCIHINLSLNIPFLDRRRIQQHLRRYVWWKRAGRRRRGLDWRRAAIQTRCAKQTEAGEHWVRRQCKLIVKACKEACLHPKSEKVWDSARGEGQGASGWRQPKQKVLQKLLNQSGSCEVDTGACCSLQLPDEYGTLVRACLFEKVHVNILENKLYCLKILKYAWYAISCPVSVWIFNRNGLFGYPFLFYRAVELAYTGENAVMMTYLDDDGATIRFQIFMCNTSKLPEG